MMCGNKTDQCPNCHKFIRRAIFAYHYENNCGNMDEPDAPTPPSRILSAHRPSSDYKAHKVYFSTSFTLKRFYFHNKSIILDELFPKSRESQQRSASNILHTGKA
jgi:hypothetical protein